VYFVQDRRLRDKKVVSGVFVLDFRRYYTYRFLRDDQVGITSLTR
jgi:hypothetical protein